MFLFRGTWLLLFIGLFFATTLTFANVDYPDYEGSDPSTWGFYEGSGEGEFDYQKHEHSFALVVDTGHRELFDGKVQIVAMH